MPEKLRLEKHRFLELSARNLGPFLEIRSQVSEPAVEPYPPRQAGLSRPPLTKDQYRHLETCVPEGLGVRLPHNWGLKLSGFPEIIFDDKFPMVRLFAFGNSEKLTRDLLKHFERGEPVKRIERYIISCPRVQAYEIRDLLMPVDRLDIGELEPKRYKSAFLIAPLKFLTLVPHACVEFTRNVGIVQLHLILRCHFKDSSHVQALRNKGMAGCIKVQVGLPVQILSLDLLIGLRNLFWVNPQVTTQGQLALPTYSD